jgi:hypothetical protein
MQQGWRKMTNVYNAEQQAARFMGDISAVHLTKDQIARLHDGLIESDNVKTLFEAHVAGCVICSTRLQILQELNQAGAHTIDALPPEEQEAVRRVFGTRQTKAWRLRVFLGPLASRIACLYRQRPKK